MDKSFEGVFGALIGSEFGSSAAFSEAVGLSPERISQLRSGRETSVSYRSLRTLLSGFRTVEARQQLYEAWLHTYAPAPVDQELFCANADLGVVDDYLNAAYPAMESGRVREVFQTCRKLFHRLSRDASAFELIGQAARLGALAAFAIDRRVDGINLARELEDLAASAREHRWRAVAIWLQALGTRTLVEATLVASVAAYQRLDDFLAAWTPFDEVGQHEHHHLEHCSARDQILLTLRWLNKAGEGGRELLQAQVRSLNDLLEDCESGESLATGTEVRARAETILNLHDQAATSLSDSQSLARYATPIHPIKIQLASARLAVVQGDSARALRLLTTILDRCEERGLVHYHNQAVRLQEQIHLRSG